jgi:hypothetical protein
MMGWVLERFLRDYEADYHRLRGVDVKHGNPHPVLWSALNHDLERGLAPLRVTAPPNPGFLFRTDARNLRRLLEMHGRSIGVHELFCEEIPEGEELIVKYLSALLVTPPETRMQGRSKKRDLASFQIAKGGKKARFVRRGKRESNPRRPTPEEQGMPALTSRLRRA